MSTATSERALERAKVAGVSRQNRGEFRRVARANRELMRIPTVARYRNSSLPAVIQRHGLWNMMPAN